MARLPAPTHRLRCKTRFRCAKVRRTKAGRDRSAAAQAGLAPLARRAFPLYVKEHCKVQKGANKLAFQNELRRLGREWKALPKEEQLRYKAQSIEEFNRQRQDLVSHGIFPRQPRSVQEKQGEEQQQEQHRQAPPGQCACIGPYTLEVDCEAAGRVRLGAGGYGKVYKCRSETGRQLAVKAFYGRDAGEQAAYEIAMYGHLAAQVGSGMTWFPQLINGDADAEPTPWLAMEFAGESLAVALKNSAALPRRSTWSIVSQLKSAVLVLHDAGLLHLDIKPGNILWCSALEQMKLCDFGMAERQNVSEAAMRFEEYVTLTHRPPELHHAKTLSMVHRVLTPAVDKWSYGCTVFNVVTGGHHVFAGLPGRDHNSAWDKATLSLWCASWADLCKEQLPMAAASNVSHLHMRLRKSGDLRRVILGACNPKASNRLWPSVSEIRRGQQSCL